MTKNLTTINQFIDKSVVLQDWAEMIQLDENKNFKLVSINVSRFDANKHLAQAVIGDAKVSLTELSQALGSWKAGDEWNKNLKLNLNRGMNI